uniref:Cardiomyopathy associated 5 n=1 Tax=Serinus canaria TaxID=9135 RepID=A0A8C9MW91_SERCA
MDGEKEGVGNTVDFSSENKSKERHGESVCDLDASRGDLIQSEDVKPKLHYIMTNPSFSMVTCQSEDSGITWETSSSRCSTPWTSETSTTSDLYSMESSPVGSPPGKVIFIMDEGKIVRKRTRKSSNRAPMATRPKGGQCNKKRDSSGMQRQEPRTVLGDVQASMLNVEQVEAQDTDEEMLDNKEDQENIAEEPVKRAPIRSIFRESRLRKVGPILGGPVQARIQLFNSIFGGTGSAPETSEKNRIRRSSSASGDSEKFLETSVKERLQKFGSLSAYPKHFQGARSKILETPSERRRKQQQQFTEQANQSFSSPTSPLDKQLTKRNDVSSESNEPYKMKESTLQLEERKERQPLLETPNQVSGHLLKDEEEAREQQSHSAMARTSITESTTSTTPKSDKKQVLLPSAKNANKKPDQSLLTASDHLDEGKKQEVRPNSAPQSVSADFVSELDRPSSQHILPTESMSEHPERETEKSYLPDVPSAKSEYSTSTEIRQEDIILQSSEAAQSESEHVPLPHSGNETEKQETECPSSTTLSESATSRLMYSAEREESHKTPSSETQNVHLENQTKSEQDFSLQKPEKQGMKLKPPIPENIDSKYFGISYPVDTETEETQKTSAINKAVDFDHSDFSIEENKQAEGGQMEMELPDLSYSTEKTGELETTQMETEHLDFSSPREETEELKGEQMEMEHPDFSFSREEIEEPGSAQLETELPDFSYSKEETEGSESAITDTDYPELLFSTKEREKSGRSQLETEQAEFSSKEETKEPESAQLEMEHPDFSFSREEMEQSDSAQLEAEVFSYDRSEDLSYSRKKMVESESAQLEMEHPDSSLTKEVVKEMQSAQLENEHQVLLSREETENQAFSSFELEQSYSPEKEKQDEKEELVQVHSDLSLLMEETEKENTAELQLVHPERFDSTGRAETQQTGYLETAFSDLPYPINKTKGKELSQTDKGKQPLRQDSQSEGKLDSSATAMQGETTQLQSEHPVWPHSTREEQKNKTSQLKVKQTETTSSTGKTEHQKLQPKPEQTDPQYSQGETVQEAVQRNLEGPEPSSFISEAEQHENAQVVSEKKDFSFITGETTQAGVESGTLWSQLTDRAKPRGTTQMEQEQSFPSCSTQQQETPPLNVPQPDVSWSFGNMEQDTVQREVKQQETDQQEAVQMETEYSDISESLDKEEPQVIDQINLAQQEITRPGLVHPSLPYSFSKQMQEMQAEPAYPEKTFYVSTETENEIVQHKSEQQELVHPKLEQTFLPSSIEKEAPLEMEITSEYPDFPYSSHKQEKLLKDTTLPFHLKQQETEPVMVEHPDVSWDSGESKQADIVEQESGHPELSYTMGETQHKSEHLDSQGSLSEAQQDESMELESQYPKQSCSQLDSKYSDSSFSFGKGKEQSTQKFESEHQELPKVGKKRASPGTAQTESKHTEIAPWETKHPDLSHSTGETSQEEAAPLDQKHRKLSFGREKQQKATKQELEQEKLTHSPNKRDTSERPQECLEKPNLSFSIDRPDDEMIPPDVEHTDLISPLDNTEIQRRVKEREQMYPFGQMEQKTVQPEVELSHLSCSVGTAEETEPAEPGQGHSDLPYSVFKVGGLQTSQLKPEHPGLAHSLNKVQEAIQLGLEKPGALYGDDKTEQIPPAQLEPGHASLAPVAREAGQRGTEHTAVECSKEEQSVSRAEHPQVAKEKQRVPDAPSLSGKMEQREMLKAEPKPPDPLHSIDKGKPQRTTQPVLEKADLSSWPGTTEQGQTAGEEKQGFLHSFKKEAQGKKAQTELGHLELCHSLSEAEQGTLNAKSHHSDLSAGTLEHHEIIQPEAEIMDLSFSIGETQQTQIADEDLECLDLFHSTGTVQQEKIQPEQEKTDEFSSSIKKAEEWKDAGMKEEHPELQCSMETTEGLQNSQANSEYADLSFSVGTAEPHKTTQPELKEQGLLHSFVKTKPSWAALPESEHANVMDATGKGLHTDLPSSVSKEKQSAQLEVKQERGSYTLHPEEIVQLKLEQPVFSSPHGMEEQPNTSPVEGEFPDILYSSGKSEKQDTAQAGFTPSDISYSTGKSEQLQSEKLNSKHPDLSYSLGKAETHVTKPLDLSYSCGKADQPQTAQLEHPEKPYFTGETNWRYEVQPEQPHVSLQPSDDVETEQPEIPAAEHTFVRAEEKGTAQPDFKQSDLLSPTYKAEKREMAPLRAGHSQKQDTGAPSSQSAQLETEQQNLTFSTEEADSHKIQPYSSLTEQTVPVPLVASHTVSETSPEGSPKSSPVTGGSPPRHLDIPYSSCKTEHSETALPEPGASFVRKEAENTESLLHLPVATKSEAECEILPEAQREETPHYFHTATQLESEQLNLSYSTDKIESLESQDYLTVPSKLQSESSVPFYAADETCQQEVPPYSKPVSEYMIPTQSLAKQENQNMQPFITQPIQSECEHVIPPHNEQQLQKIQPGSPETASLKTVHLESVSQVQDQDKPESSVLNAIYLSPDQLRSSPKFTTEQYEQEMQPDVLSVTTESKETGVADQKAVSSEPFIPFHKLPGKSELEKPVSVALTDDEEKQNIPSSLSDVADMLGKQSNKVSGIYTEGEHIREMQRFEDQKHTTLEHLRAVSSDLVHETATHKTQHYSGELDSLSSAEIKPLSSSSEEKQNPDIPPFGLASWLVEEVKACSVSPIGAAEEDMQGIQLTPNEASDFGSKQFPAGSCTEFKIHGTTEIKEHTFRVSESVSNKFSHRKSSDTSPRTQSYDLPSLVGDNQGPDKLLEHETSTLNTTKIEGMQHLEVGKMPEVPGHYLRGEEEEMEHASAVEDSQCALETTEQKDLFNIISEGYEILNIHAPRHISSVDQEESKHMPDKLEYLETNPSFRSKSVEDGQRALTSGRTTEISESSVWGKTASHELIELVKKDDDEETEETQEENLLLPEDNNCAKLDPNNGSADMDYFEKYTLIDDKSPIKPQFERRISLSPVTEDPNESMEEVKSFKESTEVDTLEEFSLLEDLDEVFYGTIKGESKKQPYTDASKPLPLQKSIDSSSKSITNVEDECKSPGTPLFDSEEGVLERSLLFPTTVAAVNPELLEEPPALSFLYKDLYAEAVGEKTKDETPSDEESGNSNASFPSRNSDTDDGTGIYFEKYILKDEIPSKAIGPQKDQIPEDESFSGGILVWNSENKQEEGSGDVQYVKTEVLSERVVMERDKFQVDSTIQATICKPMHAIPFGSKTVLSGAGTDTTEQREEENVPVERTEEFPEQPNQQRYNLQREEQHGDAYEDFAESMDYDVITQEELLQDEISSQFTHEELLFEDRDSFDHAADSYEFVNEPEQRTPVELEDSGFVVMYPEKSATNIPQVESPQRELKKAQVDTYCYHCKCPISAIDKLFGEHKDHEVTTLDDAATKMKVSINLESIWWMARVWVIENFCENCKKNADLLEKQNEEMLKKVVAQYDEKSENFEEVKKMKMEYLYEQMVNFQQTVDSAKETLETTVKETDEVDGFVFLNVNMCFLPIRLLSAMDTTLSLEKVPSAFSLFEHYADSPGQSNQHSLQHVAVPQTPTVIPQEPNSATSTSIAVYWAVNDGDTIDCFQVYCTEELQATLVEEYRVTVKESHCILEDLEPDRCYSVWVMAVNGTGCSLPSEKAVFKTAPAVPTIKAEDCTVCWDTATVRWRAASVSAESFILEYCRQHSPEGEGLRSFAGIKKPELKISLEPNVNYFFYLRAVNPFGTSEQSEAALISTKGTRFRLLSDTAHPALQISSNATVIHLPEKTKLTGFPSVLGELLPAQGCHYWEIVVSACRSYRIGICYEEITQSSVLGLSDTSWCMRCCPTQTRFLHTGVMSDVHVTEHLARIGILLDYSTGRLLFFNAERGLVLFAIRHNFTDAAHPAFALEKAGVLTLCTGMELPEFVKQS